MNQPIDLFLLLDTSAASAGDPENILRNGLRSFFAELSTDRPALDAVRVSVIAYGGNPRELASSVPLADFRLPDWTCEGPSNLRGGLRLLQERSGLSTPVGGQGPDATGAARAKPIVLLAVGSAPETAAGTISVPDTCILVDASGKDVRTALLGTIDFGCVYSWAPDSAAADWRQLFCSGFFPWREEEEDSDGNRISD